MELFENNTSPIDRGEKTVLVFVKFSKNKTDNDLLEFKELANSSGVNTIKIFEVSYDKPNVKYLIGSGKVEEISEFISVNNIEVVIFSQSLTPSQERNLEKKLSCRVIDKTSLILDIFALRAKSFEGKLQVELAQLRHLSTRLIRGWTHLERQKGGIGLKGPGETQLETDRRLIGKRIKYLNNRLEKVDKQRKSGRQARVKNRIPVISLVGYTNAGKSSLFNALTNTDTYVDNKLFATLDTTLRKVTLPASGEVILADTVGFIKDLPHDLIAAFKSTLEETKKANLLLHVIDSSSSERDENTTQVNKVLSQINADEVPLITIMNKIDKLNDFKPRVDIDKDSNVKVWLSVKNNQGLDLLKKELAKKLTGFFVLAKIKLKTNAGAIRSKIYKIGYIRKEKVNKLGEWLLEIMVTKHYLNLLLANKNVRLLWEQNKKKK